MHLKAFTEAFRKVFDKIEKEKAQLHLDTVNRTTHYEFTGVADDDAAACDLFHRSARSLHAASAH